MVFFRHTSTHSAHSQGCQGTAQVWQLSAKSTLCLLAGFVILCTVLCLSQLPGLHQRVNGVSAHLLAKYFKHKSSKRSSLTLKSRANKNILKNYISGCLSIESSHLQILQKLQENCISISLLTGLHNLKDRQKLRSLRVKVREKVRSLKPHGWLPPSISGNTLFLCSLYPHQNLGTGERKSGCNKIQTYFIHSKSLFPIS